ncbi:MAG: hypothetical protein M9949_12255 [Candidatus Kapabacteria bacterium]|nr:hypothetical protein [Candidatus Kapabacteria bacterium]
MRKTIPYNNDTINQPILIYKFIHLLRTFGIWSGLWVGIIGFVFASTTSILLGQKVELLYKIIGVSFLGTGFLMIVLMPIYGFLIIFLSHFLSELIMLFVNTTNREQN